MAIFHLIPKGDIALTGPGGDFVWIEGPPQIRQRLSVRFQFWLGEYFLDTRQGIPYRRDVFIKNPDIDVIDSLFRRVITTTPGVLAIVRFQLRYEPGERKLYFSFHAKVEGGEVIVNEGDDDFIVSLSA